MAYTIILYVLTSVLVIDAILVMVMRGKADDQPFAISAIRPLLIAPVVWAFIVSAFGLQDIVPMVWATGALLIVWYNTFFLYASDDDLCMGGKIGRYMLNVLIAQARLADYKKNV